MSLHDLMKYRESGELSDVTVSVDGEELKLHKFPLYIKSEYFKEQCRESGKDLVELTSFPGGAACFKQIADFCYNKRIDISLDNVAQLRCGSEYLKMLGENNLIDLTERFLEDVLRSAQMSRSLAPIVDLISRTACLGPAAEEAKIAERCFAAVMDVWTKPGRVDALVVDRLLRLPLAWFERLAKSCASENDRQQRPLAELASRYLHRVFQRECQQQQQQQQQSKQQTQKEAKKEPEKDKDEAGSSEQQQQQHDEDEQKPQRQEPEDDEASAAAKPSSSQRSQQPDCQQQQQQEPKEPAGEVLDRVMSCLPEATPLADVISGDWIRQALQISEKHGCECRPRLLQLAGHILHRFRQEELKQMPSPVLVDIVSSSVGGEGTDPEVLSNVIDNHLLDLARSGSLGADDFAKLAGSVPADYRANHDTLYEVAETLLTSGESIPDDKQKAVIDSVDLSRCDVSTLQRALDKGAFPAKVVCQAAIDLAHKSRQQQPQQQEGRSARRGDYNSVYSSPSRRPQSRAGQNFVTATFPSGSAAGNFSYLEPLHTGKYDADFDTGGSGGSHRYATYDSGLHLDGDRSNATTGIRLDFQAGSRGYSHRKY